MGHPPEGSEGYPQGTGVLLPKEEEGIFWVASG